MPGNGAPMGSLEPLPGISYNASMSTADIYPTHIGIGGIRTQDRAIPAFAEASVAQAGNAVARANLGAGLFSSPAGWIVVLIVGLLVWRYALE